MKVKRVDEVVVKMATWERDRLVHEIANTIKEYRRLGENSVTPYPLALYDFREELMQSEQR